MEKRRDIAAVSAHIDVLPTFADIAGIKTLPKGQMEGRSFLPLLSGEKKSLQDRYLFTHKGRWKTGANPEDFKWMNLLCAVTVTDSWAEVLPSAFPNGNARRYFTKGRPLRHDQGSAANNQHYRKKP